MLLPRRSPRRAHRPGRPGRAASCHARPRRISNDRRIRPTPAAASLRCPQLSALQAPMASRTREPASESSWSVFARRGLGEPSGLRPGSEVGPLDPDHGSGQEYRAVTGIVPPPSEDQVPRLQAFRAEHPGYRDRQPRRLAHGHVAGLPGRQDPRGQIRPAPAARPP